MSPYVEKQVYSRHYLSDDGSGLYKSVNNPSLEMEKFIQSNTRARCPPDGFFSQTLAAKQPNL
jgi:hypothetical protein